ncbi:MAG: hypothetical protein AAGI30_10155 [Planctomycetota bacterium]
MVTPRRIRRREHTMSYQCVPTLRACRTSTHPHTRTSEHRRIVTERAMVEARRVAEFSPLTF